MTSGQFRWLPRSIDESDERVRIDKQADATACEARARALARTAPNALVIAPWRHEPFNLWVAFSWTSGRARFSPADAIATFARDGRLASLPLPSTTLPSLGVEPGDAQALPTDGIELRELMLALASPDSALRLSPAERVATARALGVDAAATEREVVEHEIATLARALQMQLNLQGGEYARDQLVTRALRRAIDPEAFRIGDEIHVVAPESAIGDTVRSHPRLRLHPVELRTPAITRLRQAIEAWTMDDLMEDPLLEGAIERLDPDGREEVAFAHARATLFRAGAVRPQRGPRAENWRSALDVLVGDDPPSAALLVEPTGCAVTLDRLQVRATEADLRDLPFFPLASPAIVPIGASLLATQRAESWGAPSSVDPNAWQDELEQWLMLRAAPPDPYHHRREVWSPPSATVVVEADWSSDSVDAIVTSTWFALRRALRSPDVIRRPNGTIQVHVGSGVCLVIDARVHAPAGDRPDLRAALVCAATADRWANFSLSLTQHATLSGNNSGYEPGWTTPRGLYLAGKGYAVDVRFTFVPWLHGADLARTLHAPIRARLDDDEAAAEAARQQQDAYDDDDD